MPEFLRRLSSILQLQRSWFQTAVKLTWIVFFTLLVALPLYIVAVQLNPFDLFGGMPPMSAIANPENDLSSEVISADGVSLGRYFRANRSQVSYDQIPPQLVRILLISEDHRFLSHSGMDFWSLLRVLKGLVTFTRQGGGSTITQQTAKNLFKTRGEELRGKLGRLGGAVELVVSKTKEWIIAVEMEKNLTKEEIIALYLNTVPFNNGAFGIKVAAETYFSKNLDELNVQEMALLIGMLQGTDRFNPVSHPERAVGKRNEVLNKMFLHGEVTERATLDSLRQLPLRLNFAPQNPNEGHATYFRDMLEKDLLAWCREHGYDLTEAGLKIYTTIDSRMQRFAEEAVAQHLKIIQQEFDRAWGPRDPWNDGNEGNSAQYLQEKVRRTQRYKKLVARYGEGSDSLRLELNKKRSMRVFSWTDKSRDTLLSIVDSVRYYSRILHAGLFSIDPQTGAVRAWVGGINHRYFQFDHVRQSKRQAGSTFKPFVFGKAIEDGISPCTPMNDVSPTIVRNGNVYQVRNFDGTLGDGKPYTLRRAMARSLNTVTVQLVDKLKPENVADFAHKLGITSPLDPVPSLGLGTSDVSLYEMVQAYASFVNLGVQFEPFYLTRIEDKHGNVLQSFLPVQKQVLDPETAYKMVYMLRGGVEEPGATSQPLSEAVKSENEIGGKTGTTDDASDGWYLGITHNLVTGVWVGGDDRAIHLPPGLATGGKSALPIFDKFMTMVYRHPEVGYLKGEFKLPDPEFTLPDCSHYEPDPDFHF